MASNDDVARIVLSLLCGSNCQASIRQLFEYLRQDGIRIYDCTSLLRFLDKYPNIFCTQSGRREADTVVYVQAPVPLCSDHCNKKGQCESFNCDSLHICKFFLLSECAHPRCAYGHILQTDHNLDVLQPFLMDQLTVDEIRVILTNIRNRTFLTKPEICRFYNIAQGCNKPKCQFLHICNHFLHNTCKFGSRCKRSHNIADVLDILDRYGIDTQRSDHQILADLRIIYENADVPLSRHGSVSSLDGFAQNSSARGQRSRSAASRQRNRHFSSPSPGPPEGVGFFQPFSNPRSTSGRPFMSPTPQQQYPQAVNFNGARPKIVTPGSRNPIRQGQGQVIKPAFMKQVSDTCDKDSLEICFFKLKGKCWYGDQCLRHHKDTIYQWQYQLEQDQRWEDFDGDVNLDIETNYCQPEKETCFVRMLGEVIEVNFAEPMTGKGQSIKMAVRRLSTVSSEAPSAQPDKFQWTTEWKWYWKGPGGEWILYGDKDPTGMKSSLFSETIETKYLENSKGAIDFGTSQFEYKLNFETMMQENVRVSTQREVRRRPQFFKMEDLKKRATGPQSNAEAVPEEWSVQRFKTAKALLGHYCEKKVDKDSEEYIKVQDLFNKTVPGNKIRSLHRIENGELWHSFSLKKTQMTTKAGKPVKELSLFHGTDKATIEPICHQGFDFRFSGSRVGAKLGKGSYFARDSIYSTYYSKSGTTGRAKMFMARVLVGDYVVGKSDYVRPPQKSATDLFELYDSCVDNTRDPSIHVVFSNEQSYPEYLIEYSTN